MTQHRRVRRERSRDASSAIPERSSDRLRSGFSRWWPYYLMMAPGLLFFLIWHYFPIWEAKMAFEQVRIIPPNIWVGPEALPDPLRLPGASGRCSPTP